VIAAPDLAGELRLGALLLVFTAWGSTQAGALVGLESFGLLALTSAIAGGGTVLALTAGAATFGIEGAVVALVAGSAFGGVLNHLALRRAASRAGVPLRRSFPVEELPILWRFSLPRLIMAALWLSTNWAANAMLANAPGGYAQLGLLGVAMQWFLLLLFLPNIVARVLLPVITERLSAGARDDAARVTGRIALLTLIGVAAVAAGVALASPWILALYGDAYRGCAWTLALIAVAAAAASPQTQLEIYFAARDQMWLNVAFGLLWAALLIVGAGLLVDLGAVGIAMAMACAYTVRAAASFGVFSVLSRRATETAA
jgi:O-antigen/teichoic acid export membrane protein